MEAVILSKDQFEALMTKIEEVSTKLDSRINQKQESFVDNKQFLELMGISPRTAQTWRDEGKIAFSQVGNKIYYKMSDIEKTLQNYYNRSFAKK